MSFKIGSLFDGSGGFPLAGFMCGGTPVWASEVEPYPIAVTRTRFPHMKHLGGVTDIKGGEVEPVDIITFGSPCQGLSYAGLRKGLEDNRSGLFMEAVRIIKEMREATNGVYPRFALWENVPGAFSSNKGEDFRIVLEELIKIVEPGAVMPSVPQKGWPYADSYCGDGWSLAYRVFDAQYWGVPQRRRRIYLVADFRGECAREVLFEREGLRGYFAQGGTAWESLASDAEGGAGADDRAEEGFDRYNGDLTGAVSATLGVNCGVSTGRNGVIECRRGLDAVGIVNAIGGNAENYQVCDKLPTLTNGNAPGFMNAVAYAMQGFGDYKESDVASGLKARDYKDATDLVCGVDCRNMNEYPELYPTLQAKPNGGQSLNFSGAVRVQYIVRRLTPTECARLQGFADRWGEIEEKESFTEEEYRFWLDVRNTHAAINGKVVKEYTEKQMLTWYNKLRTDSAEYKMWGNGIALPCALYVMHGVSEVLNDGR